MRRFTLLLIVIIPLVAGCVNREAQKQAKRTEALVSDPTVPVSVERVTTREMTETLEITGALTTSEDSIVGAKIGGRLVQVAVQDGDAVKAGQVLAQQETTELAARVRQQRALVDAARAQVDQAKTDAKVGPSRSEAAVRASEARLKQAEAALEKLRKGAREEERIQADWAVENAKKSLEVAKAALDRARKLFEDGAIAKADVERAENAHMSALAAYNGAVESRRIIEKARPEDIAAAEQQVAAAREQLNSDRAAQRLDSQYQDRVRAAEANLRSAQEALSLAQQALSDATIRAPFEGRISGQPTQVGTYVGPGSPVARLVDTKGVYFEGDVPENRVAEMQPGRRVAVNIDALQRKVSGTIVTVNPLGSDVGRLFKVRIQLEGDTSGFKPGMFATGVVELRRIPDAVVVPVLAIIGQGKEQRVFVVDGKKAKEVSVTTGLSDDRFVQVKGLEPGQEVVVAGQSKLADGMTIEIKKESPANPS